MKKTKRISIPGHPGLFTFENINRDLEWEKKFVDNIMTAARYPLKRPEGRKITEGTTPCKYCEGIGYIVDPMPYLDCPACKGKGYVWFELLAFFRWKIFEWKWRLDKWQAKNKAANPDWEHNDWIHSDL